MLSGNSVFQNSIPQFVIPTAAEILCQHFRAAFSNRWQLRKKYYTITIYQVFYVQYSLPRRAEHSFNRRISELK